MFLESLPCPLAKLSALKLDNVMALEEGSNVHENTEEADENWMQHSRPEDYTQLVV